MDVLGWSLLTLPEDRSTEEAGCDETDGTRLGSEWWTSTVFDVAKSVSVTRPNDQTNTDRLEASLTSFNEVDDRLRTSTESLPDWERLSDSDDFCEEERCRSLNDMDPTVSRQQCLMRSNTTWYARLDEPSESKELTFKNKVISAWTNVTNGWVLKTPVNFKSDSQAWLLGRQYVFPRKSQEKVSKAVLDDFKQDFASRLWMTYRMDFSCLPGSQMRSDVGWGCMLRSGQMMLAQAFLLHFLGRDWRLSSNEAMEPHHKQIIRYFGDFFADDCPFSIHKLVEIGNGSGRQTGDWFGPASICVALRDALEQARSSGHTELSHLAIYLTLDCTVYKQDVIDLCTNRTLPSHTKDSRFSVASSSFEMLSPDYARSSIAETPTDSASDSRASVSDFEASSYSPSDLRQSLAEPDSTSDVSSETWRSVVLLMPLRLGSEALNCAYIPCLKQLLESDLCIGIIGGRPKHSLYFVGWQKDRLIYLDPHCCQKTVDVLKEDFVTETFHCSFPRKLSFNKMDPTCAIGFYCKTRQDYERLLVEIPKMVAHPSLDNNPLLSFQDGRRVDIELGSLLSMDHP